MILHGKVILPAVREAFNEMLIIFSTIFFSPSKLQLCKIICHLSDRIGVNKRIDFKTNHSSETRKVQFLKKIGFKTIKISLHLLSKKKGCHFACTFCGLQRHHFCHNKHTGISKLFILTGGPCIIRLLICAQLKAYS